MEVNQEEEKLSKSLESMSISVELKTPENKLKTKKKNTPKKTPKKKDIPKEDLEKIEKIKIEKENHEDLFQELKTFFENQKKNFHKNQEQELKKILQKYDNFKFTNLFVHSYFKFIYEKFEINHQEISDTFNYRTAFVQQMFEKRSKEEFEVADHQAFSAFLKIIFSFLKHQKSCKLYNILFAIFIFNSTVNLKIISKKQNSEDSNHEGFVNKSFRDLKLNEENEEKLYERYQKNGLVDEISPFLKDKLIPSLNVLLPYCKCSSSICGMFKWVFQCWKEEFDDSIKHWIVSASTIRNKKEDFSLRKYLFDRGHQNLFLIENNNKEIISFTDEERDIEMNSINLRIFITLAKSNTMKNIKEILDQFVEVDEILDKKK
eukprot:gene2058-1564_t